MTTEPISQIITPLKEDLKSLCNQITTEIRDLKYGGDLDNLEKLLKNFAYEILKTSGVKIK